jgi:hypothetical protein
VHWLLRKKFWLGFLNFWDLIYMFLCEKEMCWASSFHWSELCISLAYFARYIWNSTLTEHFIAGCTSACCGGQRKDLILPREVSSLRKKDEVWKLCKFSCLWWNHFRFSTTSGTKSLWRLLFRTYIIWKLPSKESLRPA